MRIGIIGTRGIPNHYGGFEQFAQYLATGLSSRGHEVIVYNSSLHPFQERSFGNVQLIHCSDWENRLGTAGQFIYDLNCINDSRKRQFDVLLHLGYTSDTVWHWRWPRATIHIVNMDGLEWKRSKYNFLTRQFLKKAEALAANHADQLIADSTGIQAHLLDKYNKSAVFIPYGATPFTTTDPTLLQQFHLAPHSYSLLMARMEPENNIELILDGYLLASQPHPMVVVGSTHTGYGRRIEKKYAGKRVKFLQGVYDMPVLNHLRYYADQYFHGHSVGGTNPSLLEAMACGCPIIAHHNIFNKAVLGDDADYFSCETDIRNILERSLPNDQVSERRNSNLHKIETIYSWEKVISSYETLMIQLMAGGTMVERRTVETHS